MNAISTRSSFVSRLALVAGLSSASALAQPVLEVRIENQIINSPAEFVFQPIALGQQISHVVVLRNVGFGDLVLPDPPIQMNGGFASQFELIQPALDPGNVIPPNSSSAFEVRFKPTLAKSDMFANIQIFTNASATPFLLTVRGAVDLPKMVVKQGTLTVAPNQQANIPNTPLGAISEQGFTIENQGPVALELTGFPLVQLSGGFGSDQFVVVQQPGAVVPPFSATQFFIAFAPTQTGQATAQVTINSNDVGNFPNGQIAFVVRSVGQAATQDPGVIDDGNTGGDDTGTSQPDSNTPPSDGDQQGGEDTQPGSDQSSGEVDNTEGAGSTGDEATDSIDASDTAEQTDDNTSDGEEFASDDTLSEAEAELVDNLSGSACGLGAPMFAGMGLLSLAGMKRSHKLPRR